MGDDPELKMNDAWSEGNIYSPERRRIGSGNSKSLSTVLIILLIFVFAAGIIYFLSKGLTGGRESLLQVKVTALEQKVAGLEQQLAELQGKVGTSDPDRAVLQRMDSLTRKVELLEKLKQPTAESKAKPSPSSKPAISTKKKYHTVQKGDTLYRISKKYRISLKELRTLNNLSADQPLRTGQKLLVSPRH